MRKILSLSAALDAPRRRAISFSGPYALSIAVELEHTGMVELLLEKGAAGLCRSTDATRGINTCCSGHQTSG
ncbi:hypothetical protein PG987_005244 [Apiospora arundinis]